LKEAREENQKIKEAMEALTKSFESSSIGKKIPNVELGVMCHAFYDTSKIGQLQVGSEKIHEMHITLDTTQSLTEAPGLEALEDITIRFEAKSGLGRAWCLSRNPKESYFYMFPWDGNAVTPSMLGPQSVMTGEELRQTWASNLTKSCKIHAPFKCPVASEILAIDSDYRPPIGRDESGSCYIDLNINRRAWENRDVLATETKIGMSDGTPAWRYTIRGVYLTILGSQNVGLADEEDTRTAAEKKTGTTHVTKLKHSGIHATNRGALSFEGRLVSDRTTALELNSKVDWKFFGGNGGTFSADYPQAWEPPLVRDSANPLKNVTWTTMKTQWNVEPPVHITKTEEFHKLTMREDPRWAITGPSPRSLEQGRGQEPSSSRGQVGTTAMAMSPSPRSSRDPVRTTAMARMDDGDL